MLAVAWSSAAAWSSMLRQKSNTAGLSRARQPALLTETSCRGFLADKVRAGLLDDLFVRPWLRRELKHGGDLVFAELSQQHDLSARKLQRVVVPVGHGLVDLPEYRSPMRLRRHVGDNRPFKRELGARDQTHGGCAVIRCAEPACAGSEIMGHQSVCYFRWTRPDMLQAIVAHGSLPHAT